MAARAPSGFTTPIDQSTIVANAYVRASHIDNTINNQHFFLLGPQLQIVESFIPGLATTSKTEIGRWYLKLRDLCDNSAVVSDLQSVSASAYVWVADAGADDIEVFVDSDTDGDSLVVTASETPAWCELITIDAATNDIEDCIVLSIARAAGGAGTNTVYCGGFLLFATAAT